MPEFPLHVETALALGWTDPKDRGDGKWLAFKPESAEVAEVPAFDRRWCDGGSLVSNYIKSLFKEPDGLWVAEGNVGGTIWTGDTPLQAVCRVVVEEGPKGRGKNG
jgi:hypothetical protein